MVFLLNEHGEGVHGEGLRQVVHRAVSARRAYRPVTARTAQGGLPTACRGRMLGERDRRLSGHASLREVERYTKAADQARMARNAMARTTSSGTR